MGTKITELLEETNPDNNDYLLIDNGTETKKVTKKNLLQSEIDKVGTITFRPSDTWGTSASGTGTSIVKQLSGITSNSNPIIVADIPNAESKDDIEEAFNNIYKAVTGNGTIEFFTVEIPTIQFSVSVKGY